MQPDDFSHHSSRHLPSPSSQTQHGGSRSNSCERGYSKYFFSYSESIYFVTQLVHVETRRVGDVPMSIASFEMSGMRAAVERVVLSVIQRVRACRSLRATKLGRRGYKPVRERWLQALGYHLVTSRAHVAIADDTSRARTASARHHVIGGGFVSNGKLIRLRAHRYRVVARTSETRDIIIVCDRYNCTHLCIHLRATPRSIPLHGQIRSAQVFRHFINLNI